MESGQYLPYSDNIWQTASEATGQQFSKDYIYMYIKQNRGMVKKNVETGLSYRLHGNSIPKYQQKPTKKIETDGNW